MATRIENVIFFGKNEMLICRGGRFTKVIITKEGKMIELEGFPGYYYDADTGEVFRKKHGKFNMIKKHLEGSNAYYFLYLNGHKSRVYHLDIWAKNAKKIQHCVDEKVKNRNKTVIFSELTTH